jgi:hypothetical protein
VERQSGATKPGNHNSLGLVIFIFPIQILFTCMIHPQRFVCAEDRAFSMDAFGFATKTASGSHHEHKMES